MDYSKRSRHYADEIGREVRELVSSRLENVPVEFRAMTLDLLINGIKIGYFKKKQKRLNNAN